MKTVFGLDFLSLSTVQKDSESNLFRLEELEPRVLLSASPVGIIAAGSALSATAHQAPSAVEVSVPANHAGPAHANLAYSPEMAVNDIFGGMEGSQLATSHMDFGATSHSDSGSHQATAANVNSQTESQKAAASGSENQQTTVTVSAANSSATTAPATPANPAPTTGAESAQTATATQNSQATAANSSSSTASNTPATSA
ncbi:MAG TPA: LEPR-XLL domain-containing protein, partial [Verrucomicrobiae bacterium]|nr:LEPR-XLL domain-containing protein [Verrucomicrobiae bacterium]